MVYKLIALLLLVSALVGFGYKSYQWKVGYDQTKRLQEEVKIKDQEIAGLRGYADSMASAAAIQNKAIEEYKIASNVALTERQNALVRIKKITGDYDALLKQVQNTTLPTDCQDLFGYMSDAAPRSWDLSK